MAVCRSRIHAVTARQHAPSACCFKKLESKRSFRQYKHHAVRDWRCVIFRSEIPVHVPTLFFDV